MNVNDLSSAVMFVFMLSCIDWGRKLRPCTCYLSPPPSSLLLLPGTIVHIDDTNWNTGPYLYHHCQTQEVLTPHVVVSFLSMWYVSHVRSCGPKGRIQCLKIRKGGL